MLVPAVFSDPRAHLLTQEISIEQELEQQLEEERRLAHVAFTRAKERLYVTRPRIEDRLVRVADTTLKPQPLASLRSHTSTI